MSAASAAIPYEKQSDPQTHRGCGAACLSMVYRSLGKEVDQAAIWPAISKPNRFGSVASTTHLMASHAIQQGLQALIVQARHPLQVLKLCRDAGIRAILNHRLDSATPAGHYTVLLDLDVQNIILHDPLFGPSRRIPPADLLELWQPRFSNSEISGNVLIGISATMQPVPPCQFCRAPVPDQVECPKCRNVVKLQPAALLGCVTEGCIARLWNTICCPACDHMWSFTGGSAATAGASNITGDEEDMPAINLPAIFAEIDKFTAMLMRTSGASDPDLKQYIDLLQNSKEELRLAQIEHAANIKVRVDQMRDLSQQTKKTHEAQTKRAESFNQPPEKLDGDKLGRALLKNLGFVD